MRRIVGSALLVLASTIAASGQTTPTTRLIPFSGTAVDSAGVPVSGEVAATFELYEEQEGGAPLWRETQRVQPGDRGRYLVYLGSATPIPQVAFTEERARWLAVTIGGRALPRVMLVAVPYALRAADADTLGGQPASSFVRSRADGRLETSAGMVSVAGVEGTGVAGQLAKWSGPDFLSSSVISESSSNRVGVGLTDPTGGGVVDSVFTIRNFDNNTGFAVLNQTSQRRFALNTSTNGGWTIYDGAGAVWNAGLRQVGGRLGLGTTPLSHKFEVTNTGNFSAGVFLLSNSASSWYALQALTTGTGPALRAANFAASGGSGVLVEVETTSANLIVGQAAGTNRFRVSGTGAVFGASYTIGGADFAEQIEPAGDLDAYGPGDVLVISADRNRTVARAHTPYATGVIGVYSTEPGIVASPYPIDDPRREGKLPVAMIGIVPCKVSAENGPIARGDLLVTSSTPGHAMKGTDRAQMTGAIVGKALEPLVSGTGVILIAVTLQ